MFNRKKIVIFCSASYDIEPKFNEAARDFVRTACSRNYAIVSGGTVKGTMGVIADEIASCGGYHIGIIPRFMEDVAAKALSEVVWTETMSERKEKMREGTVAAIALPGGVGTLDELIETLTLAKLDHYPGKILALNLDGFYNPLKDLLDHYVDTDMLDKKSRDLISFPETVEELLKYLD